MVKTIASLSGGKSSSYMALHFPADVRIFAVVLTDQPEAAPSDSGLLRECRKRIPGFVASREADSTLRNMLWLEQELGMEVEWVCAYESQGKASLSSEPGWLPKPLTFDRLVEAKKSLPNRMQRWCTEELKYTAIYWHTFLNHLENPEDIVFMDIGIRADESHRVERILDCKSNRIKRASQASVSNNGRNSLVRHEWRVPFFPMVDAGITQQDVLTFWKEKPGVLWPGESNCDMCFFKSKQTLKRLSEQMPDRFAWWEEQEKKVGATFGNGFSLKSIRQGIPESLFDVDEFSGFPCACTD